MKPSFWLFLFLILLSATDLAAAETRWINNITVSEYNITWGYTETFSDMDSIGYKISIDTGLGDNDSFVNAWELLKADKEARNEFKSALENDRMLVLSITRCVEIIGEAASRVSKEFQESHQRIPYSLKMIKRLRQITRIESSHRFLKGLGVSARA